MQILDESFAKYRYRSVLPWLLGYVLLAYASAADNCKASSTAVTVTP